MSVYSTPPPLIAGCRYPRLGSTEIWEFANLDPGHIHPMHVHSVDFQVLDTAPLQVNRLTGDFHRLGIPVAPPAIHRGWRDMVSVPPMHSVRVIMKFSGYTGRFP